MSEQKEKSPTMQPLRTVREIIDNEFMTIGDAYGKIWTREELEEHHRIGDLIDEKLALGYTVEQSNAEWKGKSSQEILANADTNGTAPHIAPGENREVEISRRVEAGVEKTA